MEFGVHPYSCFYLTNQVLDAVKLLDHVELIFILTEDLVAPLYKVVDTLTGYPVFVGQFL